MSVHAPVDGNPVPFAGVGPKTKIRWDSRGTAYTGVVHATTEPFETGAGFDGVVVTALCGRKVRPLHVYSPGAWPRRVEEWHRNGRTSETFTCGRGAQRTEREAA